MSLLGSGGLLDDFLTLGKDELDVARVGHVGVDLSLESAKDINRKYGGNIHDREHGRCVCGPWGPG